MKFLLVDDDPVSTMVFGTLLSDRGHEVTMANDGLAALYAVETKVFDAIVLDLLMPKVNGLEFLVESRREGTLTCPAIVVTAMDNRWTEGVPGVAKTLIKPVDPVDLIEALREVTGQQV